MSINSQLPLIEKTPPTKRGPTPKLQQQVERLSRLPLTQQRVVMQMLEAF